MAESKQYCRYCNNLVTGNGIYCTEREKELSEAYTKTPNRCKFFEFNEIDAYGSDKPYKPRKIKEDTEHEQFRLEFE